MRPFLPALLLILALLTPVPVAAQEASEAQQMREQLVRMEERLNAAERERAALRQELDRVEARARLAIEDGAKNGNGAIEEQNRRIAEIDRDVAFLSTSLSVAIGAATLILAAVGIGLPLVGWWKLRDVRRESDKVLEEVKSIAAKAQATMAEITGYERMARETNDRLSELLGRVTPGGKSGSLESGLNAKERSELGAAAESAASRPDAERTAADWLALAGESLIEKRFAEALERFDRVLFHANSTVSERASAYNGRGVALAELERFAEAVSSFEEAFRHALADNTAQSRRSAAKALFNKGVAIAKVAGKGPADAVAAFDEVVRCFGDDPSPAVRDQVAWALINKGVTIAKVAKKGSADALAVFDEVVRRFGDDPAPALRERVAAALTGIAFAKQIMRDREGALAASRDLLARFGNDPAPELQQWIEEAREHLRSEGRTRSRREAPERGPA